VLAGDSHVEAESKGVVRVEITRQELKSFRDQRDDMVSNFDSI